MTSGHANAVPSPNRIWLETTARRANLSTAMRQISHFSEDTVLLAVREAACTRNFQTGGTGTRVASLQSCIRYSLVLANANDH
jgi:hypothetical protein